MKKIIKTAGAFTAAAALLCSAGCTGDTKWAFKTDKDTVSSGMWIYYTFNASYEAYGKLGTAEDGTTVKLDDIDFGSEKIDGQTATDWIYARAKKDAKTYLALEKLAAEKDIKTDESMSDYLNQNYKQTYDSYNNYYNDLFTKLGVSSDSFCKANTYPTLVENELFKKLYGKDGEFEVKDDELKKYFKENYISYYYVTVDLKKEDSDGNKTDLDDETKATYTQNFKKYANMINNGDKTVDDVTAQYKVDFGTKEAPVTTNDTLKSNLSSSELDTLILETPAKTAVTKTIDDKLYMVYVYDINEKAETISSIDTEESKEKTGIDRNTILSSMKSADFEQYIKDACDKLDYERNDACVHKYDANRTIGIMKDCM